ncbi:MAG: Ig-like domain-containing protein [Prevotella sp.]
MLKHLRLLTVILLLTVSYFANADTYTHTFSLKDNITANTTTTTLSGVNWAFGFVWKNKGSYIVFESTVGYHIGSGTYPATSIKLSTVDIPGIIKSVTVKALTGVSAVDTLSVLVNGTLYGKNALTNDPTDYTFTGTASGQIEINFNQPKTSKAIYLQSITVEYSTTGKVAAGLSYSQNSYTAYMGQAFTAPIINNPNNLMPISYSSSDQTVATVDPNSGDVTLVGEGTTTITAESAATDTYDVGSTSYSLTVNKQDAGLSYSTTNYSNNKGDVFITPTLINPNGLIVNYNSSLADVATVDPINGAVSLVGAGMATITASFSGDNTYKTGSASYTIVVNDPLKPFDKYVRVADASTLKAGEKLIITSYYKGLHALGEQNINGYRDQVAKARNIDGTLSQIYGDGVTILTLEVGATQGSWFLYDASNTGYLYAAGGTTSNLLNVGARVDATISITDSLSTITFQNQTTRNILQYNGTSPRFSCYTSGQQPVQIYRKADAILNITEAGYATISSTQPLDFTGIAGLTLYTVTSTSPEKIVLKEITQMLLPANTAIIIKGSPGTYGIPFASTADPIQDTNLLQPTSNETVVGDGSQYILGYDGTNIGFYQVTIGTAIAANKGYLDLSTVLGAKSFIPFYGETTGITDLKTVLTEKDQRPIYNLSGQRVEKNYKGIVIINRKKYINR